MKFSKKELLIISFSLGEYIDFLDQCSKNKDDDKLMLECSKIIKKIRKINAAKANNKRLK